MLIFIIIPMQVAQWIASWTSVSNRIRKYVGFLYFFIFFYFFYFDILFAFYLLIHTLFDITIILF